jgi:hypothetical protein
MGLWKVIVRTIDGYANEEVFNVEGRERKGREG